MLQSKTILRFHLESIKNNSLIDKFGGIFGVLGDAIRQFRWTLCPCTGPMLSPGNLCPGSTIK